MTKEELEKEAEEYLEKKHCKNVCTYNEIEECKVGVRIRCMSFNYRKKLIVDFAEPKEKQIADLEEKLANADYQLEGRDNEIRELNEKIEKMKCCEICGKSGDWRNRSLCIECEKSKSHINFELRRVRE